MLELKVFGTFALTDAEGRDRGPRGAKARGLLVLLALAPQRTRTRTWLQAHLWSDREAVQASASLRTALVEIRRALGPHGDVLIADRQIVALDPRRFRIDETPADGAATGCETEAFEGLDVRDPEFENLIRDVRAEFVQRRPQPQPPVRERRRTVVVVVRRQHRGGALEDIAARIVQGKVCTLLRQTDEVVVVEEANGARIAQTVAAPAFEITITAAEHKEELLASCTLTARPDGEILWSEDARTYASVEAVDTSVNVDRLALTVVDRLIRAAAQSVGDADATAMMLALHARTKLFRLDRASLAGADELFRKAFELNPSGTFIAWRSLVRNIAEFQHRVSDFLPERHSMTELSVEAMRHAPGNSFVSTVGSLVSYIDRSDVPSALRLAERSVEGDTTSPIGWAVMSNMLIASGQAEAGYAAALRAIRLARGSDFQFYFEHFACMAAAACKDYARALMHATTALADRPEFVSARRYEIALRMERGDAERATRAIDLLRRHEPTFVAARLTDPTYPANTLRRLPLIDAVSRPLPL